MEKINLNEKVYYTTKNNFKMYIYLEENNKGTRFIKKCINNENNKEKKSKYFDQLYLMKSLNIYYLVEIKRDNVIIKSLNGRNLNSLIEFKSFKDELIKTLNLESYFDDYKKIKNRLQEIKNKNESIKKRNIENITDKEILNSLKNLDCYIIPNFENIHEISINNIKDVYKNHESYWIIKVKCMNNSLCLHEKYFNTKLKGKLTDKVKSYILSMLKFSVEQYVNDLNLNDFYIIRDCNNNLISIKYKNYIHKI